MSEARRKFTIGRDRGCDIPVADDSVSAVHAELTFLGEGKLLLTDCKSTNGTRLLQPNGREQRVHQELVSPMDRVRLGQVVLSVKDLLESLRLKVPRFNDALYRPAAPDATPWVRGQELVRCVCGTIKSVGKPCPECGR